MLCNPVNRTIRMWSDVVRISFALIAGFTLFTVDPALASAPDVLAWGGSSSHNHPCAWLPGHAFASSAESDAPLVKLADPCPGPAGCTNDNAKGHFHWRGEVVHIKTDNLDNTSPRQWNRKDGDDSGFPKKYSQVEYTITSVPGPNGKPVYSINIIKAEIPGNPNSTLPINPPEKETILPDKPKDAPCF